MSIAQSARSPHAIRPRPTRSTLANAAIMACLALIVGHGSTAEATGPLAGVRRAARNVVQQQPAAEQTPAATNLPEHVTTVEAFPNLQFERSLFLTAPNDGTDRLFLLEQAGRVVWFENRADVTQDEVHEALDLRSKVRSPLNRENRGGNEEGLLGLAFHPDFASNRYVFLHYSTGQPRSQDDPRRGVIARFTMDEARETIDPESEQVILEVEQFAGNHNGGMIAFGPDGYLYIGLGDGGGANDPQRNGQNLGTLLASILRIDVDRTEGDRPYAIPQDNPFVNREGARGEIYAYGLRNPWRFSFDRETGALWTGDVCQSAWEKIHLIVKGGNYGWPFMEGSHTKHGIPEGVDPDSLIKPIVEHPRSIARSITGGYVYRGSDVPALQGVYVYGDYVTGIVLALRYDYETQRADEPQEITPRRAELSSFGEDQGGELYIVTLTGKIYRFVSR